MYFSTVISDLPGLTDESERDSAHRVTHAKDGQRAVRLQIRYHFLFFTTESSYSSKLHLFFLIFSQLFHPDSDLVLGELEDDLSMDGQEEERRVEADGRQQIRHGEQQEGAVEQQREVEEARDGSEGKAFVGNYSTLEFRLGSRSLLDGSTARELLRHEDIVVSL